jgi:hypothetical protein
MIVTKGNTKLNQNQAGVYVLNETFDFNQKNNIKFYI